MESRSRQAVFQWADLPPELLRLIAGGLQHSRDISLIRSVCRPWRSSISPPPRNKISALFPRRFPFCLHTECHPNTEKKYLIAGAVYLLSPRHDPSVAWIASVQESSAGKLILRHALTHEKIPGSSGNSIDLSEWSVTEIAISYSLRFDHRYNEMSLSRGEYCDPCVDIVAEAKVIFVSKTMAVCNLGTGPCIKLCAINVNGKGASQYVDLYVEEDEETIQWDQIEDFVNFNGRMFAVDCEADMFVVEAANGQLLEMDCVNKKYGERKRFVVSDGDLYIVYKSCQNFECKVYKIVMDEADARCCKFERVMNLGNRVFFINKDSSFSVSALDLTHPFKGNCVVVGRGAFYGCDCFYKNQELDVFDLGGDPPRGKLASLFRAYTALFTPPSSWINQLRRVNSEQ